VFEGAIRLCPVVGEFFLDAGDAVLLIDGDPVQIPQRVLDALDGANRVRGVQVRGICGAPADKNVRDAIILLERPKSGAFPSA